MTRSVFDPTGPDTEQSGGRNLGPAASNLSHIPADVTDGRVDEEQEQSPDKDVDTEAVAEAERNNERRKNG